MDEEEEPVISDEEINDSKHANLIEKVLSLNKVQHIKKPTRSEPTIHISEYDLVKSVTGNKESVHINALTKVLKQRTSHVEIAKKLRNTERKAKTLEKPLEKPQAERIRRSIGYTNTKRELDKWEPIVTSNRAAPHLSFPLNTDLEVKDDQSQFDCKWRVKSDLQKQIEELESKYTVEEYVIEPESKFPLTLEEIMERRKETAKLRAVQSYKEAKARRQNKIKSKKFHRIQRREKIKQQIKEFELLQKTNPEEALKKLDEIEKARAEERVSLRHRSTGQWAKNKQVRAKYDKESRQVLAQQLTISRDLTQKLKTNDNSESEEESTVPSKTPDPSNPWVNGIKTSEEIDNFIQSYRKYWDEKNKEIKEETAKIQPENGEEDEVIEIVSETKNAVTDSCKTNDEGASLHLQNDSCETNEDCEISEHQERTEYQMNGRYVVKNKENTTNSEIKQEESVVKNKRKRKAAESKRKQIKKDCNSSLSTTEWIVSDLNDSATVDNVFDVLEKNLTDKLHKKARIVLSDSNPKTKKVKQLKQLKTKKIDLSLPKQINRPVIDEPMDENTTTTQQNNTTKTNKNKIDDELDRILADDTKINNNIDPTNVIKVKTIALDTQIPDLLTTEENEENPDQMAGIAEAFEDDDIIEDFNKEKTEEIEKDKPQDVDLSLPGWGTWGGKDLKMPERKRKRFIMKFPKKMPRKDDNKGKLIIKEDANAKVKEHLVSEVPFPFQTVKDFEASIRAPIGNTFVPETAFRKMVKPAVVTKMGTVIEPMSEEVLLKLKKS